MFPFRFLRWRMKMLLHLLTERRELLVLSMVGGVGGLLGALAYFLLAVAGLRRLLESGPQALTAEGPLHLILFSAFVAFFFMALANVVSGFFSAARLEEREQLMGPLPPGQLFLTELLDALRLPLGMVLVGGLLPFWWVGLAMELSLPALLVLSVSLLLLFSFPTLLIMGGYIVLLRSLPARVLRGQGLLFFFFWASATGAAGALGVVRDALQDRTSPLAYSPTVWLVEGLAGALAHEAWTVWGVLLKLLLVVGVTAVLAWISWRWLFLEHLEQFGVQREGRQAGPLPELTAPEPWLRRLLEPRLSQPVLGVVLKDLRSARSDTAQRVAFTALAAVILALVGVDLLWGRMNANLFLPIFYGYALFLVSCQALSTFSAEGGVLENLAQTPLEARELVEAKILAHTLLFAAVSGVSSVLAALAPSPVPLAFRVPAALVAGMLMLPVGYLLAWGGVCLGAIFPKPGEGGGRKEISIFAMGLFMQGVGLGVVSVLGGVVAPVLLEIPGLLAAILLLVAWIGVFRMLRLLAERAVSRALGAEMRLA